MTYSTGNNQGYWRPRRRWECGVRCMSMVSVCVGVAVRADAGGVGRAQRELHARRGAGARRQRPAAQVHAQRLRHTGARGDWTLSTPPYTGFLSYFFCYPSSKCRFPILPFLSLRIFVLTVFIRY